MQTLVRRDKKDSHNRDYSQPNMSLLDYGLTLLFNEVDQPIGRRIMSSHWAAAVKLRLNFLSQLLSQLHSARKRRKNGMKIVPVLLVKSTSQHAGIPTFPSDSNSPPLVKAVDVPDDALNEDLVLIHGCRGGRRCVLGPHKTSTSYPSQDLPIHSPIKAPRRNGVSLENTIELLGRFPSKTFRKHPRMSPS